MASRDRTRRHGQRALAALGSLPLLPSWAQARTDSGPVVLLAGAGW